MNDELAPARFAWFRETWETLTPEQRLGITMFGVCGLSALLFSGWYIREQIRAPFLTSRAKLEASRQFVSERDKELQREGELRTKDTDGDGLNDWDELNTYKTSPYVADSDSDGVSDSSEIALGQDPNCPKGRDCQPRLDGVAQLRSASSSGQALLEGTTAGRLLPPTQTDLNATQIRQFLITNGLAAEGDLRGLSDQAIVELYRRASAGTQTPSGSPPETPAPATNAVPSTP